MKTLSKVVGSDYRLCRKLRRAGNGSGGVSGRMIGRLPGGEAWRWTSRGGGLPKRSSSNAFGGMGCVPKLGPVEVSHWQPHYAAAETNHSFIIAARFINDPIRASPDFLSSRRGPCEPRPLTEPCVRVRTRLFMPVECVVSKGTSVVVCDPS